METVIDDEVLKELNANVNLLEYVSDSIEMEKRGNDYFGRCPLHIDKTPSFSITPEKNLYHCFSCGKSGGIISYLINYEKMSFSDAVNKAGKLSNIDLDKLCKSKTVSFLKQVKRKPLRKKKCEHLILDKSILDEYEKKEVPEWLNEGIKQEVMDLFGVRIDKKSNRIVYPVYDIEDNLINIKGRTRYPNYKKLKIPKYINYYEIGCMDYFQCLNLTISYIKEKNEIIIFESIKSVMLAYGWNYKNCVSAEKHSLTSEQIKLLVRMKVNVVFAYDSDVSYEQKAVKENINKLKMITNVYVIEDINSLLGGKESKNAPVDKGEEIWNELYKLKRKVV